MSQGFDDRGKPGFGPYGPAGFDEVGPAKAEPRRHGCFFYGCITLVLYAVGEPCPLRSQHGQRDQHVLEPAGAHWGDHFV